MVFFFLDYIIINKYLIIYLPVLIGCSQNSPVNTSGHLHVQVLSTNPPCRQGWEGSVPQDARKVFHCGIETQIYYFESINQKNIKEIFIWMLY